MTGLQVVNIGKGGVAYCQDKWIYNDYNLPFSEEDSLKFSTHVRACHQHNSVVDINVMKSDWRFNILVDNQEFCMEKIFEHNLYASKHYKSLGGGYFIEEVFPNCEWLGKHVINLFNDFCYTEAQAEKTARLIRSIAIPVQL